MKIAVEKKYYYWAGAFLFFVGIAYLFFNESGIIKLLKLKKEHAEVIYQIQKTEDENKKLTNEIDSIKNKVPAKVEKVSREQHNMIRKNEKAIEVIEK